MGCFCLKCGVLRRLLSLRPLLLVLLILKVYCLLGGLGKRATVLLLMWCFPGRARDKGCCWIGVTAIAKEAVLLRILLLMGLLLLYFSRYINLLRFVGAEKSANV